MVLCFNYKEIEFNHSNGWVNFDDRSRKAEQQFLVSSFQVDCTKTIFSYTELDALFVARSVFGGLASCLCQQCC